MWFEKFNPFAPNLAPAQGHVTGSKSELVSNSELVRVVFFPSSCGLKKQVDVTVPADIQGSVGIPRGPFLRRQV